LFFDVGSQAVQNLDFVLTFGIRCLIPEGSDQDFRFVCIDIQSKSDFAGLVIPFSELGAGEATTTIPALARLRSSASNALPIGLAVSWPHPAGPGSGEAVRTGSNAGGSLDAPAPVKSRKEILTSTGKFR
jgi:hypothetical protein